MSETPARFTPAMDPNTEHQTWARLTFEIRSPRRVPEPELRANFRRWLKAGLPNDAVGRFRIDEKVWGWTIVAQVEGIPDPQEPGYRASLEREFSDFVSQGFGPLAIGAVEVMVLSGEPPSSGPRAQLIAIPTIDLEIPVCSEHKE